MRFELEAARNWFAEDLRSVARLTDTRVVEAFASVPREDFLGPGPWEIHCRLDISRAHSSPDDDPRHLCHDVLVTIDGAAGINNGLPSLWAMVFDALRIRPGDAVLQAGAGTGYYTAILADLAGPGGHVVGYELNATLADRAVKALADRANVTIRHGNAVECRDTGGIDVVVACAGVTHVPRGWLARLRPGGRMMLPVTGARGWGILLYLERRGDDLAVRSLGPCGFYPCAGARLGEEAAAWDAAFAAGFPDRAFLRTTRPPRGARPVVAGADWWIEAA